MGPTVLLTHLKIIFATVFSIFNFSNNKFNPNGSSNNVICIFLKIRVSEKNVYP